MKWNNFSETTRLRVWILFVLLLTTLIPGMWALSRTEDWEGIALNFSTEMAGALVTFVLIDLVIRRQEQQETALRHAEELKKDLLGRLGSTVRDIAVSATDELRRNGWLEDGTLQEARLRRANLEGVDLSKSDLTHANLHRATLTNADLWGAILNGADLSGSTLNGARLWQVQLEDANLWQARLQKTNIRSANLRGAKLNQSRLNGADLRDAELTGATLNKARLDHVDLRGAHFDSETILPDGEFWHEGMDLLRYTNPDHPDFWRRTELVGNAQSLDRKSNQH